MSTQFLNAASQPGFFRRLAKSSAFYFALLLITVLVSFTTGRYGVSVEQLFTLLWLKVARLPLNDFATVNTVIFNVRLPRILAAAMTGSALSLSGAIYQSIFRNPMVSPGILGVSSGAGFGAALGILLSMNLAGVQLMAFGFGSVAVSITCLFGRALKRDSDSVIMLILVGMVVSTVFASFISLTKYVADPTDKLPAITFWLMGSLASVNMDDVRSVALPIALGSVPLFLVRWKLNILSFGDDEARSLGVNTGPLRLMIIVCSTVITAAAISISGIIGWVGLIIPHICRMITGPDHKTLVPFSMLTGAIYLMIVDDIARSSVSVEIPLGIITALIGAPFFLYLIFCKQRSCR
ncbi:MAG: iron ABC transporter permease [Deltaproteobacteria bacterium]|nr:iron ABC transporter permease [Deltaproteobacteria bacterium]